MQQVPEPRILIVEDDPDTVSLIKLQLRERFGANPESVSGGVAAKRALSEREFDIVTLDYKLPDYDGLKLLEEITAMENHPAVIMITGHGDELVASRALKGGASGYIVKDRNLPLMLHESVEKALTEISLRRTSEELDFERRQVLSIFEGIDEPIYVCDPDTYEILFVNEALRKVFGDVAGGVCYEKFQGLDRPCEFCTNPYIFGKKLGETHTWEFQNRLNKRWYRCIDKAIRWPDGRMVRCEMAFDITDRKQAEDSLHHIILETNRRREEITALLESTRYVLEYEEFAVAARAVFDMCRNLIGGGAGYLALMEEGRQASILFMEPAGLLKEGEHFTRMPVVEMGGEAFEAGRAVYMNDLAGGEWPERLPDGHLRIDNALMTPMIIGGEPAGVMVLANKPGGFNRNDSLIASAFGEVLTLALRNSRTREMLEESERRYRELVEKAPDVIYTISAGGALTSLNPAFEEVTGWSREEWLGRDFAELIHPEDLPVAVDTFKAAARGEAPSAYELRIRTRSGSYVVGEFRSLPWLVEGEIAGELGIARDITERKKSQERYRTLFESSIDGIVSCDLEGFIVECNRAYADMLGYSCEELIGTRYRDITPDKWHALNEEIYNDVMERGYSDMFEKEYRKKDGTVLPVSLRTWRIDDDSGKPAGTWSIVRDVTERKRAEEALQRMNVELEGYAHSVSHDLRLPIGKISAAHGALKRILEESGMSEEIPDVGSLLEAISEGVDQSERMIEEMLLLAEAGQRPRRIEEIDVGELVRNVLEDIRPEARKREAEIRVQEDLGRISGNFTQLYRLFGNLLDNAVRHNDSRRPVVEVSYLGKDPAGAHRYLVKDNGSGIPETLLAGPFAPHGREEGGRIGLGLATAEKIVKAYGGELKAYNDKGACFEFTLKDMEAA